MAQDGGESGQVMTSDFKSDFIDTFEVTVGPPNHQKSFTIHRNILCHRSAFFKAARSACWTDAKTPTKLPEDDPIIFTAYLQCVYSEKVESLDEWEDEFYLYALADKMRDIISVNLIMDALVGYMTGMSPSVYDMDWVHHEGDREFGDDDSLDSVFLLQICRTYSRLADDNLKRRVADTFSVSIMNKVKEDKCCFHEHNDEFPKCK